MRDFRLPAVVSLEGRELRELSQNSYAGNWLVLFAWPLNFTLVCPTEIAEGRRLRKAAIFYAGCYFQEGAPASTD